MAQRKQKEFILNDATIAIIDNVVAKLNGLAETIRDMYDQNDLFREIATLHRMAVHGFEHIPEHNGDLAFTMMFGVVVNPRRKPIDYMVRVNTYTNEITCIDRDRNEFSMPLLTDALSVIKEKIIEVAFS